MAATSDQAKVWELATGKRFLGQVIAAIGDMDPASVLLIVEQAYREVQDEVQRSVCHEYDDSIPAGERQRVWQAEDERLAGYASVLRTVALATQEIERQYWHNRR